VLIRVTLQLVNYIAHPYWPARDLVIDIEKKAGAARQRSEEKRIAAIKAECARHGITYDDYLRLKKEAEEQWYRDKSGNIIIPRHQIAGALVQTIEQSPKAVRGPFTADNFRALVQISDFNTGLKNAAGKFVRFVKLEGSNQRSLQENEFIGQYLDQGEPFDAAGCVAISDERLEKYLSGLFNTMITTIGVGAARKMGFGRGIVKLWEPEKPTEG